MEAAWERILEIQQKRQEEREKREKAKKRNLLTTKTSVKPTPTSRPLTTRSASTTLSPVTVENAPTYNETNDVKKVMDAMRSAMKETESKDAEDVAWAVKKLQDKGIKVDEHALNMFNADNDENAEGNDGDAPRLGLSWEHLGHFEILGFNMAQVIIVGMFLLYVAKMMYRGLKGMLINM